MPTPIPSTSETQQFTKILSDVVNQGLIGFVLLIGLVALVYVVTQFIIAWSRRNQKTTSSTDGTNAAINAFAEMIHAQNEQIEADRALRKEENAANRAQNKELQEQYIESISANADASNRNADNTDKLIALTAANNAQRMADINTVKENVMLIATVGSPPLQGLIETAASIETKVDQIYTGIIASNEVKEMHGKEIQEIQDSLNSLKDFVSNIALNIQSRTDKRATGTLAPVPSNGTTEG